MKCIFVSSQPKAAWEYENVEERRTDAEKLKERGTNYFKESKWSLAQKLYERGSELISDSQLSKDEEKEAVKALRIALHLNQAACHLKLNEPSLALKECEEVSVYIHVHTCTHMYTLFAQSVAAPTK